MVPTQRFPLASAETFGRMPKALKHHYRKASEIGILVREKDTSNTGYAKSQLHYTTLQIQKLAPKL